MVNLQDISCQLMKPAKDLANWNFPLAEILEEYYALLTKKCNINFGEAALVLQNSTSAYVRRVESLLNETVCLNDAFVDQEDENTTKKSANNHKKNEVDDDFKLHDLMLEVGKNINLKTRFDIERPVKLISRRFPQLEAIDDDTCIEEIFDVEGDVIGKKYNFRCNQHINMHGLLIDDPTPADYERLKPVNIQEHCSNTSICDSSNNITNDSGCIEDNIETLTNCCLSPISDNSDQDTNLISLTIADKEKNDGSCEKTDEINSTKPNVSLSKSNSCVNGLKSSETVQDSCIKHDSNMNNLDSINNASELGVSTHTDQLESKNSSKKNKKMKYGINISDSMQSWEPVPLTQNVLHKKGNKTCKKFLKCSSLATSKRKRKIRSKLDNEKCLVNLLLNTSNSSKQKDSVYCQTSQSLMLLKQEELNELDRAFQDCFKNKEQTDSSHYQTLQNITIDLLQLEEFNSDEQETEAELSQDDSLYESDILAASSNITDSDSRPVSPIDTSILTSCTSGIGSSLETYSQEPITEYEKLIESKIKKLLEKVNVQTELDRTVEQWHRSIRPKLAEIESRPTFHVQKYASSIIKALQEKKQRKITFRSIVEGEPGYKVARYFLALLQLANACNVDIITDNDSEQLEIILLDQNKTI